MIIRISLDIKKSVLICDNLWTKKTQWTTKKSVDKNEEEIQRLWIMDKGAVPLPSAKNISGCRIHLPQPGRQGRPWRLRVLRQQDIQPRRLRAREKHNPTNNRRKGVFRKEIPRHEIPCLFPGIQ